MQKSWTVYNCELVDLADMDIEDVGVQKAIQIYRDDVKMTAVDIPKGFTTKVLLDYDFSDDEQVLSFVREYGPVMCPYAGAIERTFAAIEEPVTYRRLLHSISYKPDDSKKEDDGSSGFFARLFGRVRNYQETPRSIDKFDEAFAGCDAMWDAKRLFYMELHKSTESEYARTNRAGFMRYLEDDDKLVGTERIRAAAMNKAAREFHVTGQWVFPDCLIALEEVRSVLYLLQVSAIVMQGFSFIDDTLDERRNAEIQRHRYKKSYLPRQNVKDQSKEEAECTRRAKYGAENIANQHVQIRRMKRLFGLFIAGRPNIIKAFKTVRNDSLASMDRDDDTVELDGIFSETEQKKIERRLEEAQTAYNKDDATKALLNLQPAWWAWGKMIDDVALFLSACLTSCWSTDGHRLIETPALRVGSYATDGGAYFAQGTDRMTLQRAIAKQIVSNLDFASKKLHQSASLEKAEPVWQICECCGLPFIFRNTSKKLISVDAERRSTRNKLPSAPTCSDICRMRLKRTTS